MLHGKRQTVADGNETELDPPVRLEFLVECPNRNSVRRLVRGINHAARPERIVHRYQSARPNELHTLFEVDAVAGLVGVDEGEIVLFLLAVADQPAQGFLGRCNPQVDLSPDISPGHQKWNPTCCKRKTLAIFQV